MYIHPAIPSVAQPVKLLKGFKHIFLKAGEDKKLVSISHPNRLKLLHLKISG
ncbi:MAG: fibronectin type III-like domain-contianing protein [Ginsengibacter sp.]